jgi:DNA-binding FadR family transcriptional regulator
MRELRQRQRAAGIVTTTLAVPASDLHFFRAMAARARKREVAGNADQRSGWGWEEERLAFSWAAASGLKARIGSTGERLSAVLAKDIAVEIGRLGFPVGRSLGSEAELLERYGVSAEILHEALVILEQQTVAALGNGPDAKLDITEQQIDAAAYLGGLYLEYCHIDPAHIHEIRMALELLIVELVIARLDDQGEARIRAVIEVEQIQAKHPRLKQFHRFHLLLAELTGNPALKLFMEIILRVFRFHNRETRMAETQWEAQAKARTAHRRIAAAVLARDVVKARAELSRYLEAAAGWIRRSGGE